jgi:uncharacterized protein YjbI with pentapeptide repeats
VSYISNDLALLLKTRRPPSQALDLHSIAILDTDLQGADLSGADLRDVNFLYLNLKGANLSAITTFSPANFFGCAWWEASQISLEFRNYLEENFRFDPRHTYASGRKFTEPEYQKDLARLKSSS